MNRHDLTNLVWKINAKIGPECLLRMSRLRRRFPATNWSTQVVNRTRAQAEAQRDALKAALLARGWEQDPDSLDHCLRLERNGRVAYLSVDSVGTCYEGFQFEVTPFIYSAQTAAA